MPASKAAVDVRAKGIEHAIELMARSVPKRIAIAKLCDEHRISKTTAYDWVKGAEAALVPKNPDDLVHVRAQIESRLVALGNEAQDRGDFATALRIEEARMRLYGFIAGPSTQVLAAVQVNGSPSTFPGDVVHAIAERVHAMTPSERAARKREIIDIIDE